MAWRRSARQRRPSLADVTVKARNPSAGVACADVANVQFARVSGRQKELAVRAAMGATFRHPVVQLDDAPFIVWARDRGITLWAAAADGVPLARALDSRTSGQELIAVGAISVVRVHAGQRSFAINSIWAVRA